MFAHTTMVDYCFSYFLPLAWMIDSPLLSCCVLTRLNHTYWWLLPLLVLANWFFTPQPADWCLYFHTTLDRLLSFLWCNCFFFGQVACYCYHCCCCLLTCVHPGWPMLACASQVDCHFLVASFLPLAQLIFPYFSVTRLQGCVIQVDCCSSFLLFFFLHRLILIAFSSCHPPSEWCWHGSITMHWIFSYCIGCLPPCLHNCFFSFLCRLIIFAAVCV